MAEVSKRMGENFMVACCVPGGLIALRARLRTLGGIKVNIFDISSWGVGVIRVNKSTAKPAMFPVNR